MESEAFDRLLLTKIARMNERFDQLVREQQAFEEMLEELLVEHAGKFVVIRDGSAVGIFQVYEDAYRFALDEFGLDEVFFVSEVKKRTIDPTSFEWAFKAERPVRR